jgi:hypothetical protein
METFCSFLVGPKGNSGYYYVGRVHNLTIEAKRENGMYISFVEKDQLTLLIFIFYSAGERLIKYGKKLVKGPNGVMITRNQLRGKILLKHRF